LWVVVIRVQLGIIFLTFLRVVRVLILAGLGAGRIGIKGLEKVEERLRLDEDCGLFFTLSLAFFLFGRVGARNPLDLLPDTLFDDILLAHNKSFLQARVFQEAVFLEHERQVKPVPICVLGQLDVR